MAAVTVIGLDIGSSAIRAVQTSRGKDGPAVTNAGQAPLPAGAVQGGVIQDDKAVTAALKQLWSTAKFKCRKVVLGVTNAQVVVRPMDVANLPDRELRKALPFQVRDALPLALERSLLDFYPLEERGAKETLRGLLIAAPKDAVLNAVQAVERAGLHVSAVDLASFALLRAASRLDSVVEAIVDIGAQVTSVLVHLDGEPLIVRTVPRGSAEVTQLIAARLDLPAAEAEALKCRVGLLADESVADGETADVIREAVRPLITEIRNSFAYLTAGEQQRRVTRLALSGGGAQLPGLLDALSQQLGVEAVPVDPTIRLRRTGDELAQLGTTAAVSIGLTLVGTGS
jgi:type IV pilus assembly protein PilM